MARVISSSDGDLLLAAKQIQSGGLVAFPTETVYGLGARLTDSSLAQIFAAKKRPYSDPLICHFDTPEHAKRYVVLSETESALFDRLSARFWPGPFTIVAPSASVVPPLVMAGTGSVGVRVPNHSICHRFLEFCGEPVAAPSANLFGHVSPTTVEHVQTDLGNIEGLLIVSGGNATIGIESTVVKIQGDAIAVLRPGFVTAEQLEEVAPGKVIRTTPQGLKLASPGHELRHYAPNLETYLGVIGDGEDAKEIPDKTILVDFNRTFAPAAGRVLRYFDMSPIGLVGEAISKVYNILREAEQTEGAKLCIIADVVKSGLDGDAHDAELVPSLRDRLLRAASHQIRQYRLETQGPIE
jgi:tRNA threonylcarbamoyl adenosine modification protein (Sua5/YciO/YrdC/YwlC family)